jgi:multiple sugar transport system substrate-binding protein
VNLFNQLAGAEQQGLSWDIAQYPSYKELPNIYGSVDAHWLVPTKGGKHPDAVMKVLGAVTSDEVQLVSVKQSGRVSPLIKPEINRAFATELPYAKGKRLDSIFKSKPAPFLKPAAYDGGGVNIMKSAFDRYLKDEVDLNTALRQAEETHNAALSAEKAK